MQHLPIRSLCAGDESQSHCQLFLQSLSVSFSFNAHCSQILLFIVWLMVTLKNLFERSVICGQMEVEKATHKSLYDINILVAWEEVTQSGNKMCSLKQWNGQGKPRKRECLISQCPQVGSVADMEKQHTVFFFFFLTLPLRVPTSEMGNLNVFALISLNYWPKVVQSLRSTDQIFFKTLFQKATITLLILV